LRGLLRKTTYETRVTTDRLVIALFNITVPGVHSSLLVTYREDNDTCVLIVSDRSMCAYRLSISSFIAFFSKQIMLFML
jgi:hypothetical protein